MSLPNTFASGTELDTVTAAIKRDGYAIIENLLDESELHALRDELEPKLEQTPFGEEDFWGHRTKRFGALIPRSKMAQRMLMDPQVLGVADRILLEWCAGYWVNYSGVMYLAPGESAQSLHRDTNLWPFANPSPPLTLATMWAVNDFTADNGGTLLVPGSHSWNDDRQPARDEIFSTEMSAGSVLLYTGNVIHGGGANVSDDVRYGVALHYVLGWLRQEETQLLTMTREEALELPEDVRKLMGYSLGASSLGMVDHLDPHHMLTGIREDKPRALSTPELDANEAKMNRLKVVAAQPRGRTRFEVE